ncbi:MAG: cytochrome c oxidase subunit II [Herpetosiphonaceae bacterium]|nr:cytochrome c oxidase subunit II [Herpetosiphonaceae bacterium]
MWNFPLLPDQASTHATQVDRLGIALLGLSLMFAIPVCFLIVFFSIKYRRGSPADRSNPPNNILVLEWAWMILPLILALGIFTWAALLFFDLSRPPANALNIDVVAKQWMWKVQHAEGRAEINELHVPIGRPIKLTMTSQDVIHDFSVPAFRVKHDVLPNRYTTLWFQPTKTGTFHLFCMEYCGTDHSIMGGDVVVMSATDFEQWLNMGTLNASEAAAGQRLFRQYGCSGCHGPSAAVHAPSLAGLYGKSVPLSDGSFVLADAQYIHDSIYLPNKQIAAGYPAIMPSFKGQLSEDQVLQLVEYIKSLANSDTMGQQP